MPQPASTPVSELRVLQLVPVLRVGGLERVATTLSLALHERVARVVVCSKGGPPFEPALRAAGVPVEHVPRPTPKPGQLARSTWALARVLRREQPHVLHAHNPAAALAAVAARRLAGLPHTAIVATYHGVLPGRVGRATRVLAAAADAVVGVGPSSTRALLDAGLADATARTIHNAVDATTSRSADEIRAELDAADAELVVTVGRYAAEKNQALLLEAAARLAPSRPRLRVVLVGDGPLEDDLRRRVVELGLDGVATVTGERGDAVDVTAAGDVFVLSSDSEGLPLVLLEAMAAGTPVVATRAGGVADAIEHERTGLLVPVGDAGALAEGIARLLDDAGLRARLAGEARRFVERTCSPAAMVDRYLELYVEVVDRRRSAARRNGASPSR
jgi:glycosyltransferase involved in cell wall biosynthesis